MSNPAPTHDPDNTLPEDNDCPHDETDVVLIDGRYMNQCSLCGDTDHVCQHEDTEPTRRNGYQQTYCPDCDTYFDEGPDTTREND